MLGFCFPNTVCQFSLLIFLNVLHKASDNVRIFHVQVVNVCFYMELEHAITIFLFNSKVNV